jgi:dihydropyrimidinase
MKILIKNGTIVTSTDICTSDILVSDDHINRIENGIETTGPERIIDATGSYIFPGGIDPHVHMHLPSSAGYSSDDFLTGSKAALYGGTTTLIDFVTPLKGESLINALWKRLDEAKSSLTDYSFHVSPIEWHTTTPLEINDCIQEGITSFKVYMAYKETVGLNDSDLHKVMTAVTRAGGMVTIHCETGDEIELLRNKYFNDHCIEPMYHPLSRPPESEARAVKRALDLAFQANCPLYIVHVSCKESLKPIQDALKRGQKIFAETCPQYLILDDSGYNGDFLSSAPYIISPPLRKKQDNNALWDGITGGIVNTVGTDHCPFNFSQKEAGRNDFRKIPNGAGGVEHRLELLYTFGVLENRITLNRMVDLFATQPAKIFGLYPSKGDILVGADADLVIWNPEREKTISAKTHHQNCDINIYEGIKTRGNADYVIAGGKVVIDNCKLTDNKITGKYIKR